MIFWREFVLANQTGLLQIFALLFGINCTEIDQSQSSIISNSTHICQNYSIIFDSNMIEKYLNEKIFEMYKTTLLIGYDKEITVFIV